MKHKAPIAAATGVLLFGLAVADDRREYHIEQSFFEPPEMVTSYEISNSTATMSVMRIMSTSSDFM